MSTIGEARDDPIAQGRVIRIAQRHDNGQLNVEGRKIQPFLVPPQLNEARLLLPAARPDSRDMRLDVGFGPGAGLAPVKAVIVRKGVLPLGRDQVHVVAADPDVDGNVLAFRRVSRACKLGEQLVVYLLERVMRP
ncbi:hypothetical protein, partial [Rhizobium sp. PDO1-076]|uniref:hypothetical protein n=1 Tax=Rhizobium sp. PDO1-076 TaxID=1125979 RepID=UPI001AEC0A84